MYFVKPAAPSPLLCAMALTLASSVAWSQTSDIERIKDSDAQLSCAQIHGEMADMDKVAASAKEAQASGSQTAMVGTAGNAAAEVAGATGVFGRIGGLAGSLFGKAAAKAVAGSAQDSGQQTVGQSTERAQQATARKDHLATLFANQGCKSEDLAYNPPPPTEGTNPVATATIAAAASTKAVARNTEPYLPNVDPDLHFKGKMGGTFGKDVIEILPAYKRVAVVGFRLAFVTKDSATAQVRASSFLGRDTSGAKMTVNAALAGVDAATMQAVTDKAYADFLAQLKLAGREVVAQEELKEFLAGQKPTPSSVDKPYAKEVHSQTWNVFAPTGMPLWFTHGEAVWSDAGMFDLNNWRRLGEYSKKLNAIMVAPLVVVNFVSMQSSGNQSGLVARTAEADAIPGMSVRFFHTPYNSPVDEGGVQMKNGVSSEIAFGSLKQVTSNDNKAVKGIFDALGAAAGLANAGGANKATSNRVMQTNNADYSIAAQDVLAKATGTFARLFQKYAAP